MIVVDLEMLLVSCPRFGGFADSTTTALLQEHAIVVFDGDAVSGLEKPVEGLVGVVGSILSLMLVPKLAVRVASQPVCVAGPLAIENAD